MVRIIVVLLLFSFGLSGQDGTFYYELDLTKNNDAFNVSLTPPQLSYNDNIYSFVAYARGVQTPLDFGRFIKSFRVYDRQGNELITNKISINDFRIMEPAKVAKIVYEIDDSFDMEPGFQPIFPMNGTGITPEYTIVNTFGVFGYFKNLKDNPVELKIKVNGNPKIGTALHKNDKGGYESESYYSFCESPIFIGEKLSYASSEIGGVEIEFYVYSPKPVFSADILLEETIPILESAMFYIGYPPVKRYTFFMYFSDEEDTREMPVFTYRGAYEQSRSSTLMVPADKKYWPFIKNSVSHDFMHILCPLNLHSDVYEKFDFSNPQTEDYHLWLYEGVTLWAAYAMRVNGGIITFDDYLDYLSENVTKSQTFDTAYSLTRISLNWDSEEGLAQYQNIYYLGPLTAAMLDFRLLELSKGKRGLKALYFDLLDKYGEDKPFDNETFFDTLVAMTYPEIGDFIDVHIKRNTPFEFEKELKQFGINFYKKRKDVEDKATMGYTVKFSPKGRAYVSKITDDYVGTLIKEGDTVYQINDIELRRSTSSKIMADLKLLNIGDEYEIRVKRGKEEMDLTEKMYALFEQNVFEVDPSPSNKELFMQDMIFAHPPDADSLYMRSVR